MASPVKAVLFDAVGTVLDPDPPVAVAYYQAGRLFGSRLTQAEVHQRFHRAFRRQERQDFESGARHTDETRERRRWREIVADVFFDVVEVDELFTSLWNHFANADNWVLFDDVAPAWEELTRRGVTLGLASNFDARLHAVCRAHEPLSRCGHVFVSSELRARKPQREFFAAIARALGCEPREIMLVGDSLENDYRAAQAAGWHAVLLTRDGDSPEGVTAMRRLTDVIGLSQFLFPIALLAVSAALNAGTIETIAGTGKSADGGEAGLATKTNVGNPFGVEIGPDGALYITEVSNHRVRRLDRKTGRLTTVAGNGRQGYSGDGGPATEALLNEPYEVRFDAAGNMYFVEMKNHLIRRVDAKTGRISTLAGTGKRGYRGDGGPATKAQFSNPHSIALDGSEGLHVADIGNHRIRRIDLKTGTVETIAGTGERKLPRDGAKALGNPILGPRALCIDGRSMWIALREGNSVWRLNLDAGTLHHVAGTGKKGYSGDGGDAKRATFAGPKGIAVGPQENVYVVDTENQAIRKIDPGRGTITTVAGAGPKARGYNGDAIKATRAQLNRPHGICVGPDGAIYLGDSENHRVRRVK